MYRQSPERRPPTPTSLAAWRDYLAHYNHGRGFVLIGHSQGAYILERLIREQIEGSPALRKRLVSAILLGGSVSVEKGSDTGGTFRKLPVCRRADAERLRRRLLELGPDAAARTRRSRADGPGQQHRSASTRPTPGARGRAPITPLFPWFAPGGDRHVDPAGGHALGRASRTSTRRAA